MQNYVGSNKRRLFYVRARKDPTVKITYNGVQF